ncbi:MAG: sugar ABC transporter permease [Anaerolineales bacterium]|nr:sugar ABC transporter permease [Anaerolineales bacterium]
MQRKSDTLAYYLMSVPGLVLLVAFTFVPLFYSVIAFQKFTPARGIANSPWVGLDNFLFLLRIQDAWEVFGNTLFIATLKIVLILIVAVTFALLLNEVRFASAKRAIQTMVYLPHFLSWVILAGILRTLLAREGLVNDVLGWFGVAPIPFLGQPAIFPWVIIGSDIWKEFGFEAIIYLAALTSIDPTLYEVAEMDGANRLQKMIYISLPSIAPTIILVASLGISNVLNANFDQIYNLYSPIVYSTGDVLDTYVYRVGLLQGQYSIGTTVGLLKTVVSLILIGISYWIADRFANYRIF